MERVHPRVPAPTRRTPTIAVVSRLRAAGATIAVAGLASLAGSGHAAVASAADEVPPPPTGPGNFEAPAEPDDVAQVARVDVVADVEHVRPGRTFHLAFVASLAKHWHTYWENPGDTGVPLQASVEAPAGFEVGEPRYPRPQVITGPTGTTYGYEEHAWIFIPVTAPADLEPDGRPLEFEVDLMYLVCRELCLIGQANRTLTIPAATAAEAESPPAASEAPPGTAAWLERVPRPLTDLRGAELAVDVELGDDGARGELRLRVPRDAAPGRPVIVPAPGPGVRFGEPVVTPGDDGRWNVRVPLALNPANALGKPFVVRGLVGLGEQPTDPAWRFERTIPIPAALGDGG